jgi:hypothetical protein
MANPVWPVSLPQSAFVDNFQESVEDAQVEFTVEAGPPKRRRLVSSPSRMVDHNLVLTTTQRAALLTFYETTCKKGTLIFDMVHPIDGGAAVQWQFREPPTFQLISGTHFTAALRLRKMP